MKKLFTVLALLLTFTPAAHALSYTLDLEQGFRHHASNVKPVGFITSLQIGPTALRPDFPLRDPSTGGSIPVVGVMREFQWSGASGDPKQFNFNVSTANKNLIQALIKNGGLQAREVRITYQFFDFDGARGKYFSALRPQSAALSARFLIANNQLHFSVEPNPDPTVPAPVNFRAYVGLNPGVGDQFVVHTPSWGRSIIKAWIHNGP